MADDTPPPDDPHSDDEAGNAPIRGGRAATNASILDHNICASFCAEDDGAIAEEAFWRFRSAHDSKCSERLAWLTLKCARLIALATRTTYPMLPARDGGCGALCVRIELDDFIRERIHHAERACSCGSSLLAGRLDG